MAHVVKDRVQETSTTTGTGTLTLGGAVSGFQTFSSAIGNTNTTYYAIQNGAEWEVGIGTVGAGTLSRDTILESSNAGSAVNLSAGTKNVFCTYPAEKSVDLDTAQTFTNKTISGSSNTLSNIGNSSLTNSSITINGSPVSLGGSTSVGTVTSITAGTGLTGGTITGSGTIAIDSTVATLTGSQTFTNKTISGADNTLSNIGNSSLTNSSVTVNGTAISLGQSATVTASTTNALTIGTGLSGSSFNGGSAVTIAIDSTVATLTGSQTLTNKTISVDDNTVSGIAATSFVLSNSSGNIDGAAAQKAIPSGVVVGTTDTQTLTNKRVTPRVSTTTSSATPTINTDNVDIYGLTAQAVDITSFTTNLSGTPTDGQKLMIYIVGTAARAITWGASFEASTVALPTTTVSTNRLDVGFIWNAATSKWRCVAVA